MEASPSARGFKKKTLYKAVPSLLAGVLVPGVNPEKRRTTYATQGDPGRLRKRYLHVCNTGDDLGKPRKSTHDVCNIPIQKTTPESAQGPLQVSTEASLSARGFENTRLSKAVPSLSAWALEERRFSQATPGSDARRSISWAA